ncbi:MAG: efflux RND transporter permease subunit [Flavobacteriales bacterium]|nr:efflux RND transporter permease subunit [Flavobacteriales bacterium]
MQEHKKGPKEFFASSWSIDNKTSIFIFTIILTIVGILSYNSLPKEKFPDIVIPTIMINTVYPGSAPSDIENLVTKPIEKQIKAISGVKKLTSNSVQDFSMVVVEFSTEVDVTEAKRKVKDAVDKAKSDLPNDMPQDPSVMELDFSEMPILFINISGDYDLNLLKKYAEMAEDKIEALSEITRVDLVGALDREVQIDVDMYKMEAAQITLRDIENAVAFENMRISGGNIKMDNMQRTLSVSGEFDKVSQIENILINGMSGASVYLRDIATIKDGFKEQESFARLDHKNVLTLNVIKRSGENLILASDKCRAIVEELQKTKFPKDLNVVLTGDQSHDTRVTLHELLNTIIIGFILVTLILMFFMGATNAIFVALSVPLSCFIAFLVFPTIGFSLNMIVLFAFLLSLGIVVDDAIVVIENTHRIFNNGKVPIAKAAKEAAGEVFLPVLAGTLTTLAPFIPLAFWSGIIGKFMFFLPITLIVTLLASLAVAYIINPVFAVQFMKPAQDPTDPDVIRKSKRSTKRISIFMGAIALLLYITGNFGGGNFVLTLLSLFLINKYLLAGVIDRFQKKTWPSIQDRYARTLTWCLQGKRPWGLIAGTIGLFFISIFLLIARNPGVIFFPSGEPHFVYTYITLPVGTDQAYTDKVTREVEDRIYKVLGENNPIVESVISNVAVGATDPQENDNSVASNKAKVSVSFVQFDQRNGESTSAYLSKIREAVKGIPGAAITVSQENNGPPTSKPISIEVSGDDFDELILTSNSLKRYLDSVNIEGVEELKSDLVDIKPEIVIDIDRDRANREGISTAQIGMQVRNAVFGKEVSKFKDDNDDYPIQLRFKESQRSNINQLMNLKISYRDMNMGGLIRQVPLSSVAEIKYGNTYGGIKRKNQKRVVTVSSNVLGEYNANEVVAKVGDAISTFNKPESISIVMGGEMEEQKETGAFLGGALLTSIGLIILILVIQFNSISKPLIILTEILFSIIGVLLGFAIFGMEFSIVMTGIGIVALAGIVVRNGILLVEFTDELILRGMETKEAIIEAGRIRMTPVILTASAAILGLIPLAIGLNIDFVTLFTEFDPKIFLGGDSVAFWGPLSWTMIFGLGFATIITLILVPAMYLIAYNMKLNLNKFTNRINE